MQEFFVSVLFACLSVLCIAATLFACTLVAAIIKENFI